MSGAPMIGPPAGILLFEEWQRGLALAESSSFDGIKIMNQMSQRKKQKNHEYGYHAPKNHRNLPFGAV